MGETQYENPWHEENKWGGGDISKTIGINMKIRLELKKLA
jgi:hypothetical protein